MIRALSLRNKLHILEEKLWLKERDDFSVCSKRNSGKVPS